MELIIRTVDKADAEDASKRGDVIEARPDGWEWSERERGNPAWMIVCVPGLTAVEAEALTCRPLPGEGSWRRRYGVNLDGFDGAEMALAELRNRVFS